jgi:hypothetical protein
VYVPFPLSYQTGVYAAIAIAMILVNLFVFVEFFPRRGGRPRLSRAILVGFVLVASAGLWATVLTAVLTQSFNGWTVALFGVNIMMMSPFVWATSLFLRASTRRVRGKSWLWPVLLASSITGNEVLMGATFVAGIAGVGALYTGGLTGLAQALASSVSNVWFFWAMMGNMVVLLYWVELPRAERWVWLGLASTSAVGPWVLAEPAVGAAGMGVVMLATLLVVVHELRKPTPASPVYLATVTKVAVGFAVMAVGAAASLVLSALPGSGFFFAAAAVSVMIFEVALLIRRVIYRPATAALGTVGPPRAPAEATQQPA